MLKQTKLAGFVNKELNKINKPMDGINMQMQLKDNPNKKKSKP